MTTHLDSPAQQIRLPLDARAAHDAREFVEATLTHWNCLELRDEVTLVVSEVVTNAVVHAKTAMTLTLLNMGDCLQIRVRDGAKGEPKRKNASEEATGGRGIFLVEAICRAWGVDDDGTGKVVWLDVSKH